jgi:hypothetical protein
MELEPHLWDTAQKNWQMDWQDSPWTNHLLIGKLVQDLQDGYKIMLLDISHAPWRIMEINYLSCWWSIIACVLSIKNNSTGICIGLKWHVCFRLHYYVSYNAQILVSDIPIQITAN